MEVTDQMVGRVCRIGSYSNRTMFFEHAEVTVRSSQRLVPKLVLILVQWRFVSLVTTHQAIAKLIAWLAKITGHHPAHIYRILLRTIAIW
jgi:hypothetical protein